MTGFIGEDKGNLKKLLRIALVGIKPADQVLLKGYLRVLLRLEVDLEWVAAHHEKVDLFMINKEFQQATSVIKLLSNQPQKPVLYTSRTATHEGWIKDDQLVLPLKTLNLLNDWLQNSVAALKQGAGAVTDILQKNQWEGDILNNPPAPTIAAQKIKPASSPALRYPKEDIPSQSKSSLTPSSSTAVTSNTVAHIALANSISAHDYQGFIIFIQQLKQRPIGLYNIVTNHQTVAIVEPSHARIWLPENVENHKQNARPILSLDWQLRPYIGTRPNNNQASDLVQYLWQYAWMQSDLLLPLVSDEANYQLYYWIKPAFTTYYDASSHQTLLKKDRQMLLSVMTALETASLSVNQLANIAHISVKSAKKVIASLLFSGSLKDHSYAQLYVQVSRAPTLSSTPMQSVAMASISKVTRTDSKHQTAIASSQSTDDNLHHNPSNDNQAAAVSNSAHVDDFMPATAHTNRDASPLSVQQQKRGFLASLRNKLGL